MSPQIDGLHAVTLIPVNHLAQVNTVSTSKQKHFHEDVKVTEMLSHQYRRERPGGINNGNEILLVISLIRSGKFTSPLNGHFLLVFLPLTILPQ